MNTIKSVDDPRYDEVDERYVIQRDEVPVDPREWYHLFVLWNNNFCHPRDDNAESPFDEHGKVRPGIFTLPVHCHDHGIRHYMLSDDGDRWDTKRCVSWLWTTEDRWNRFKSNMDPEWNLDAEIVRRALTDVAQDEIDELNLVEEGCVYKVVHERKRRFTKTYEDNEVQRGHEWVVDDEYGGFLTDDPKSFGLDDDTEVFTDVDLFVGKEKK